MALFVDGPIATPEDLRAYESSILDMASTEGIDLTTKLALAHREVGIEIHRFLVEQTASGTAAPDVALHQVIVTDALLYWLVLHTLTLSFRDAYHNELNDRYQAKWQEYERQAAHASERYLAIGVGIANAAVGRAGVPLVTRTPGIMPTGTYEIRVAWVNGAGDEGSLSDWALFDTDDGSVPVVTAGAAPIGGVKWNVYASLLGHPLQKQNVRALSLGESFTLSTTGLVTGSTPSSGQTPDYFLRQTRLARRS
jgi:hypothetical protein